MITELTLLSQTLKTSGQLLGDQGLTRDAVRLDRRVEFLMPKNGPMKAKACIRFATSLKALFDSVKDGINSGQVTFTKLVYQLWGRVSKRSVLPLFLSTLTQRIFYSSGRLREDASIVAIDLLLSLLRLTKRLTIKCKPLSNHLKSAALLTYVNSQKRKPSNNKQVEIDICLIWKELFVHPISPKVAFPGPGSVRGIDKETYSPRYTVLAPPTGHTDQPYTLSLVKKAYEDYFGLASPFITDTLRHHGDHSVIPFDSGNTTIKLTTVPKDLKEDRIIGTADAANVAKQCIIAAALRQNTIDNGLQDTLNIEKQELSGQVLENPELASTTATIDWSGGSSNVFYSDVDKMLPRVLAKAFAECRTKYAEDWYGNLIECLTLQFGDRVTVEILTKYGFVIQTLARIYFNRVSKPMYYEMFHLGLTRNREKRHLLTSKYRATLAKNPWLSTKFRPLSSGEIRQAIEDCKNDPRNKQVGDDAMLPKEHVTMYLLICKAMHVKINKSKSSYTPDHKLPESCGTFVYLDNQGYPHRLAVLRAPVGDRTSLAIANGATFIQKLGQIRSPLLPIFAHSFSEVLHHGFRSASAFTQDSVGAPLHGGSLPVFIKTSTQIDRTEVTDTGAYLSRQAYTAEVEPREDEFGTHFRTTLAAASRCRVRTSFVPYSRIYEYTEPDPTGMVQSSERPVHDKSKAHLVGLLSAKLRAFRKQAFHRIQGIPRTALTKPTCDEIARFGDYYLQVSPEVTDDDARFLLGL